MITSSTSSGVTSMRRVADFADRVTAGIATRGNERRQVRPSAPVQMTCLCLVRHYQTEKAVKVSSSGDSTKAVWLPKYMVTIEPGSERGILVVTMPWQLSVQKGLFPCEIDGSQFNEATREVLVDALARATRKRNAFRKDRRLPHARHDTQSQFC